MEKEFLRMKLAELVPYENKPRHNEEAVDATIASMQQCGNIDPIEVDEDNVILSGHTRRLALMKMGYEESDVIRVTGLTDLQKKKYRILANKTNEFAGWDFGKLEEELDGLDFEGFDFGFLEKNEDVYEEHGTTEEDDYPFDEVEAVAKYGDIYRLGNHVLMCGSSTDANDVDALMGSDRAEMLFTSPPYSDMRDYEGGKDLSVSNISKFISVYRKYVDYQCVNLGIQRKDNDIYEYWNDYIAEARNCGYKMLAWNVWDKGECGSVGNQSAFIPIRHEWIFVFGTQFYKTNLTQTKKSAPIYGNAKTTRRQKDGSLKSTTKGDQSKSMKRMESVVFCTPIKEHSLQVLHPAAFPVNLAGEYIKSMSKPGDIVVEPFGGSGTTLIACEELGRRCRIMELEPKYVDVILNRWEQYTGSKAERIKRL